MSEVQVTTEIKGFARLKIHSGKIQEFKDRGLTPHPTARRLTCA